MAAAERAGPPPLRFTRHGLHSDTQRSPVPGNPFPVKKEKNSGRKKNPVKEKYQAEKSFHSLSERLAENSEYNYYYYLLYNSNYTLGIIGDQLRVPLKLLNFLATFQNILQYECFGN